LYICGIIKKQTIEKLKDMETKETKRSWLRIVKEIEEREPKELTEEYCKKYLRAIGWLLISSISEEEAARYHVLPKDIEKYYQERSKHVEQYIKTHF